MDDFGFLVAVGLAAIICGFIGRTVGERKGRAEAGFLFGALLGPIGILIIAVGPDVKAEQEALRARKCPACKGIVPDDARKCMHCGEALPIVQPTPKELTFDLFKKEYQGEIPLQKYGRAEQEIMFKQWRDQKMESLGFKSKVQKPQPSSVQQSQQVQQPPAPEKIEDDSQIPCPLCGQQLKISTMKQGDNWCSFCFQKFIVE